MEEETDTSMYGDDMLMEYYDDDPYIYEYEEPLVEDPDPMKEMIGDTVAKADAALDKASKATAQEDQAISKLEAMQAPCEAKLAEVSRHCRYDK
jgi:hypothetical protein